MPVITVVPFQPPSMKGEKCYMVMVDSVVRAGWFFSRARAKQHKVTVARYLEKHPDHCSSSLILANL